MTIRDTHLFTGEKAEPEEGSGHGQGPQEVVAELQCTRGPVTWARAVLGVSSTMLRGFPCIWLCGLHAVE